MVFKEVIGTTEILVGSPLHLAAAENIPSAMCMKIALSLIEILVGSPPHLTAGASIPMVICSKIAVPTVEILFSFRSMTHAHTVVYAVMRLQRA